jgi:hypothetical protein
MKKTTLKQLPVSVPIEVHAEIAKLSVLNDINQKDFLLIMVLDFLEKYKHGINAEQMDALKKKYLPK